MADVWTIYGIRNCDTMKKARAWLDGHGVPYRFHDYKTEGIDKSTLKSWIAATGVGVLVNRNGTTFRALPDERKANLTEAKAIALMTEQPSVIKRPVLTDGATVIVGFKPETYATHFEKGLSPRSAR